MAAAITQAAGGCQCEECIVHFTAQGCNGNVLSGTTVSVYKSGSLIASDVTDGSGDVYLNIGAAGSGFRVTMSHSRFTTYDSGYTVTFACTGIFVHQLLAASGYTCISHDNCTIPLADTLYLTLPAPISGTVTLSHTIGNTWALGSYSVDYPGCGGCPPQADYDPGPILFKSDTGAFTCGYLDDTGCPSHAFGFTPVSYDPSTFVCPPSFSASYDITGDTLFCANTTASISE